MLKGLGLEVEALILHQCDEAPNVRLTILVFIIVIRSRMSFTVKSIDKQDVFQQIKYLCSVIIIVCQLTVKHLQTLQLLQLFLQAAKFMYVSRLACVC